MIEVLGAIGENQEEEEEEEEEEEKPTRNHYVIPFTQKMLPGGD